MNKNTQELIFQDYVKGMMAFMGSSEIGITKMWQPRHRSKIGYPNPFGKPLEQLSEGTFRKQLHLGSHLTTLQHKFLSSIHQRLPLKIYLGGGMRKRLFYHYILMVNILSLCFNEFK